MGICVCWEGEQPLCCGISKHNIMWVCVWLAGHLRTDVGFLKLVALPDIQIPPRLCGLARTNICHLFHFHLPDIIWQSTRPQLRLFSNPFILNLVFVWWVEIYHKTWCLWTWLAKPNRMVLSPGFWRGLNTDRPACHMCHIFCHWHKARKEAKIFWSLGMGVCGRWSLQQYYISGVSGGERRIFK